MLKSIRFYSTWRAMRAAGWAVRNIRFLPAWFINWYDRHLWTPFGEDGQIRPEVLADSPGPNYGYYRVGAMRED